MSKIYLQRHTRPDIEQNICYGVSDIALHSEFLDKHLGEVLHRLEDIRVDRIYSSPLQRCNILANEIGMVMGISEVTIDNRTLELNFGDWELRTWDEIFESERGRAWFDDYVNLRTPNGEAFSDMVERAKSLLRELKLIGGDVMVVTHSGFMRAMMVSEGVVTAEEAFSLKVEYGELIVLEYDNEGSR